MTATEEQKFGAEKGRAALSADTVATPVAYDATAEGLTTVNLSETAPARGYVSTHGPPLRDRESESSRG